MTSTKVRIPPLCARACVLTHIALPCARRVADDDVIGRVDIPITAAGGKIVRRTVDGYKELYAFQISFNFLVIDNSGKAARFGVSWRE